jgi:protein tyrosine phosphatase (PTP) superfamily phosphohydrolase (DUF442 family)
MLLRLCKKTKKLKITMLFIRKSNLIILVCLGKHLIISTENAIIENLTLFSSFEKRKKLKINILLILFLGFLLPGNIQAQNPCSPDSVVDIDQHEDLFRYGEIFISGQPSDSLFMWFESEGVTEVVNLRTRKENRKHKRSDFNEERFVLSLGMGYTSVPVGGDTDKHKPVKLSNVSEVINRGEKVLLHCNSGSRASYFLMAYLIKEKDCPADSAKQVACKMGYDLPLELFPENEVQIDVLEDE